MTSTKKGNGKEVVLRGIGVSAGVVTGPAYPLAREAVRVVERDIGKDEVEHEICRLEDALIETRRQLKDIQRNLENKTAMGDASILDAHLMVLDDRSLIEDVVGGIRRERKNAEVCLKNAADRYTAILASVEDDYLRDRVVDIKDVVRRILRNLLGDHQSPAAELPEKHVIIARDLAPSETAALQKEMVLGFATDLGSPTSHTAVMARALEIPAIVGLHDVSEKIAMGDEVLIDGNKGVFIIRPTQERLEKYGKVAEVRRSIEQSLTSLQHEPAETKDGRRIVLSANTEGPEEVDAVLHYGAEGVGLFRSEYLYMAADKVPGEDEQAKVYDLVAARLAPAPVIIRTFDIGGDKAISGTETFQEANPFLGCRSIRLSLLYPDHFKSQLRAILRASSNGNVKIMYPMICKVDEVIRANELLEEAKKELSAVGTAYQEDIEVGAMIEIPSAALTAETISEHVSFLSLGTNDLIQYTLAVDRVNERVAYLYEPTHPAVLSLIKRTIDAGHSRGVWVGLCGEMAADPLLTPLLLGMEVDELSVAPSAVPMIKDAVRSVSFSQARDLAGRAAGCRTPGEVMDLCRKLTSEAAPELLELI